MFGSALHVLVDDGAVRSHQLVVLLAEAGIANVRARQIAPSLEDIFARLVGASSPQAGGTS